MNLKKLILAGLVMVVACQSPDQNKNVRNKNVRLEQQLDSVSQELELTRQALMDSRQVKALLDSIDASRKITTRSFDTGTEEQNNLNRLNDLNEYVKDIDLKMDQMEKSVRYVNSMAASLLKLQADIQARTQRIAQLEAEAKKSPTSIPTPSHILQHKDSTLAAFVKNCQQDIAVLQRAMEEIHKKNSLATANLYYKQAEALVAMSENVNTASKRKLVKREALEMYKISHSLGMQAAQKKISVLEAEL